MLKPHVLFFLLCASAFTALFAEVAAELDEREELWEFDRVLSAALHEHLSEGVIRILAWVTLLGSGYCIGAIIVVVSAILLWRRRWQLAAVWIFGTASGIMLNAVLKILDHRPRPLHDHGVVTVTGWSFPSGHAAGSMLVYSLALYLILRQAPRKWTFSIVAAVVSIVCWVGFSRVLLQVHYLSDVLAGYALAASWVALCVAVIEVFAWGSRPTSLLQKPRLVSTMN